MNVVHVINSMSSTYGGSARATLLTVRGLNEQGVKAQVLTKQLLKGEIPLSNESFIHFLPLPRFYYERWGYAKAFPQALKSIPSVDAYHVQGLWQYPGYITANLARKEGVPYLITLHGSLYPEALAHSSLIKKTALSLFQCKMLQDAACIHTTCTEEMEYYRSLGFTNPVALLPYPMECSEKAEPSLPVGVKRFGYLGRIHSRKRVERLFEIWYRLNEPGELLVMGDGEPDYMQFLKNEVKRLGLQQVRFTGFVTGEKKNRLLASLTCLVVPSDFENCGLITPEALLQEVPVIATTGSPWQELETHRCGYWVNNDVDTLTEAVSKILNSDHTTLQEMGKRGRQLVLDKYAVGRVSEQMVQLYDWVTGKIDKPDFIYY